jgi:hypothetical protein
LAGLVGLAAGLGSPQTAGASEPAPVRVGTWDRDGNLLIGVSEALLARLYADVGQPMVFVDLPTRRAGQLLTQGQLDANVHRASDFLSANPEVIAVPTPLNRVAMRAYTVQPTLQAVHWKDLAALRVAHLRGVLRVEQLMLPNQRRVESASVRDLWRLLATDVADVVLVNEMASAPAQHPSGLPELRRLEHVFDEHPVHHVLWATQARLASRLNTALIALQSSGNLDGLQQSALAGLMRRQGGA